MRVRGHSICRSNHMQACFQEIIAFACIVAHTTYSGLAIASATLYAGVQPDGLPDHLWHRLRTPLLRRWVCASGRLAEVWFHSVRLLPECVAGLRQHLVEDHWSVVEGMLEIFAMWLCLLHIALLWWETVIVVSGCILIFMLVDQMSDDRRWDVSMLCWYAF